MIQVASQKKEKRMFNFFFLSYFVSDGIWLKLACGWSSPQLHQRIETNQIKNTWHTPSIQGHSESAFTFSSETSDAIWIWKTKSAIHFPYPCFRKHSISSGVDPISMRHISLSYIFLGAYNFKASGTRFLITSEGFFKFWAWAVLLWQGGFFTLCRFVCNSF